jgi:hypothetical protein
MKRNNEHKTQLGYDVPEDYFEHSKAKHLAFLERKNTAKSPKKIYQQALIFMGCIGGLLFATWFFSQPNALDDSKVFEQLTIESLEISDDAFDDWFDENFILSDV